MSKIAIAGPNGTLGPTVIHHLITAGFDVVLLTRNPEKASQSYPPPIDVVATDYNSVDRLTSVLLRTKPDSLVVLINRNELDAQTKLIDAAVAANVPHVIPSCFGADTSDPRVRELPSLQEKVAMEDHLLRKAKESQLTWTGLNTSLFFDWALKNIGIPVNLKNDGKPSAIYDGGNTAFSVTTLDRVGEAIAQILLRRDEVRNRFLSVHSGIITQNQLLKYAQELAPEKQFPTIPVDTEAVAQQAYQRLRNGETGPQLMEGFLLRITFGLGLTRFSGEDNELLGLKQWNDDDVKAYIGQYLK